MSNRLEALESKLPPEVLAIIRIYDSHQVADLVRQIEFKRYSSHVDNLLGLRLKNGQVWIPIAREMKRRLAHNSRLTSRNHGVWMPILWRDAMTWNMSFDRWRFETLEQFGYLPDWVADEYRLGLR
jgi:hypothetical protein